MAVLIKGMKIPPKGEYEFALYVDVDGEAYLESPSTLFPENFECIEVPDDSE